MIPPEGWPGLFAAAFRQSRNPMVLLDDQRKQLEVNGAYLRLLGYSRDEVVGRPVYEFVAGGPRLSPERWAAFLAKGEFTGEIELICAGGATATVLWGAHAETVTGRRLVLFVALSTARWGRRFRRDPAPGDPDAGLSEREREIVELVALGRTGPEIADELQIAHDTVRTHVRNAMEKVGARSRAHLVAKALGDGHVAA
jgi:DNA-binding CsgD family transcriptional regulator